MNREEVIEMLNNSTGGIDWSKAPDGAEWAIREGDLIQWIKDIRDNRYMATVTHADDLDSSPKEWVEWRSDNPINPEHEMMVRRPKRRGGFQKGKSGNPAGRKPGEKNKKTLIKEAAGVIGGLTSANTAMIDLLFSENSDQAHWALDLIRKQMLK